MGIFSFLAGKDINEGVKSYESTGGVLLDVREKDEYRQGHIKGSINLPLSEISGGATPDCDKGEKLYVYCLSGGRSASATSILKRQGFLDVNDIGGITGYKGQIVR